MLFVDPNAVCTTIVEQLRRLGFSGEITASKLRHGSGETALLALDFFCDKLLQNNRFNLMATPAYPKQDGANQMEEQEEEEEEEEDINDDVPEDVSGGKRQRNKTKQHIRKSKIGLFIHI